MRKERKPFPHGEITFSLAPRMTAVATVTRVASHHRALLAAPSIVSRLRSSVATPARRIAVPCRPRAPLLQQRARRSLRLPAGSADCHANALASALADYCGCSPETHTPRRAGPASVAPPGSSAAATKLCWPCTRPHRQQPPCPPAPTIVTLAGLSCLVGPRHAPPLARAINKGE
jgi:hypothetical protein